MQYVVIGCQSLLSMVLLAAVAGKLRSHESYIDFVKSAEILVTHRYAKVLAPCVIVVESSLALLVALPATADYALIGCVLLMTGFSFLVLRALRRRVRVPCNCFGTGRQVISGVHLLRNVLLAGVALIGAAILLVSDITYEGVRPMEVVIVACVSAVGTALVVSAEGVGVLFAVRKS